MATVRIQREDFDVAAEQRLLAGGGANVGAVVTFTGICRGGEGADAIAAMTLEHYPGMAEQEIARHVEEAERRWPLMGVTVIHRHGRLTPGENIVLVVTASAHRGEAFAAAEFLMDFLKTRAPFWKQEERADGKSWVVAKDQDDLAAERWRKPKRRTDAAEEAGYGPLENSRLSFRGAPKVRTRNPEDTKMASLSGFRVRAVARPGMTQAGVCSALHSPAMRGQSYAAAAFPFGRVSAV